MEKIIEFVKHELAFDNTGHDLLHARRVVNNAKKILKEVKGNELVVITACYLHDVVDEKLFQNTDVQINKIRKLLKDNNYSTLDIDEIINIITTISFHLGIIPQSINAKIVQDADRLDALGSIGIIRAIQYGQSKNRPFYEDINLIKKDNHYEFNEISNSTLSHFYQKLLKLENMMNTDIAKTIAKERTKTMKLFLDAFYQEINE